MTLIFSWLIVTIVLFIIPIFFENSETFKPTKITYIFFISTIILWIGFVFGIYSYFPTNLANLIWDYCWIILIGIGIFAYIYEIKNSWLYITLVLFINSVNFIFFSLSIFIGNI